MMKTERIPDHPIESIFAQRWSPRAYEPASMPLSDLLTTLEAARWAPSAYNIQPWRFLYSLRGDNHWQNYLNLLDPFNESWAQNASAIVFVLSDSIIHGDGEHPEKKSNTHSFDAGAAWAQLALQATSLGYQAHAMAGIYFDKSQKELTIPKHYRVEIAIAIGKLADSSILPKELKDREQPSQRLSVNEIAFAGVYPQ